MKRRVLALLYGGALIPYIRGSDDANEEVGEGTGDVLRERPGNRLKGSQGQGLLGTGKCTPEIHPIAYKAKIGLIIVLQVIIFSIFVSPSTYDTQVKLWNFRWCCQLAGELGRFEHIASDGPSSHPSLRPFLPWAVS